MNTVATVLLVDDNSGDIRLTQESFRDLEGKADLRLAHDGPDAMAFLRREGVHLEAPRPDLILLDLNLPKMNGLEVLSKIKGDPSLRTIPTIILTTSQAEKDVVASYQLRANCYLRKPEEWDDFERLMRSTFEFWLKKVQLPLRNRGTEPAPFSDELRVAPAVAKARVVANKGELE